ncbi:MAG: VOC family protein [Alphaproteobacteria bacterium]
MFSHVTVGSNDLARAETFYSAVMPTLGQARRAVSGDEDWLVYGPPEKQPPHLLVCRPYDGRAATAGNGFHIAFRAADEGAVRRFHETALAHGGSDEGAPGLRTIYAPDYYGAYVRDPDGNKLQAVCYLDGRKSGPSGEVISHITVGHAHFERERAFYTKVLETLGLVEIPEESHIELAGFGTPGCKTPIFYVQQPFDRRPASFGNGTHVAFTAATRQAVDHFHAAALEAGGSSEGAPGPRPHYSAHYYGAYVRDQVGNKLQAVCREPV